MSYLAAVILKDRARLIDITTIELDAALAALCRKYNEAKVVLAVAKDQRSSRAPKEAELFELLVGRAEGFRLPDGSFTLNENSIVRLFKNILENDNLAIFKRTLNPMDLEDEIRGAADQAAREARQKAKEAEEAERQARRRAEEAEREARRQFEEAEREARRQFEEAEREARRKAEEAEREAKRTSEEARIRRLWFKSIPLLLGVSSIVALSIVALPIALNPRHSQKAEVKTVPVTRDVPCGASEIHFSDFEAVDAGLIAKANRTILMAAYSLTDRAIIDALVAAQDRGVDVKLVLDPTQKRGDLGRLRSVGNWSSGSQMLLDVIVIDGIIVRTGSANFSQNGKAQPSDVIIERCPAVAEKYASLFAELFEASR